MQKKSHYSVEEKSGETEMAVKEWTEYYWHVPSYWQTNTLYHDSQIKVSSQGEGDHLHQPKLRSGEWEGRPEGYQFYWYNLKAVEGSHSNTIYGNRKKYCRELFKDHTKMSALLYFQCFTISKIHSYIFLWDKNTFPPELHWGQQSNPKLLTQH
jgi:hypothetical protein